MNTDFWLTGGLILSLTFRKEYKEGGETEGKEKRQYERAQRQKEREAKERTDEAEDEEWVSVPTKEEKMRQLFDPKTEITHDVRILLCQISFFVFYLCTFKFLYTVF